MKYTVSIIIGIAILLFGFQMFFNSYIPSSKYLYTEKLRTPMTRAQCEKQPTLRQYSLRLLGCDPSSAFERSDNIPLSIYSGKDKKNLSRTANTSLYIHSNFFSQFQKLHGSDELRLSINVLDQSSFFIRTPKSDTFANPFNNTNMSYIIPSPIAHPSQKPLMPFSVALNDTEASFGSMNSYTAGFFILENAIVYSFKQNVISQTCFRAVAVRECQRSDLNYLFNLTLPFNYHNVSCKNSSMDHSPKIITVDKLAVIGHPWYHAYYHFSLEALPRLMIIYELLYLDPDIHILINKPRYRSTAEALMSLGINETRFVYTLFTERDNKIFRAKTLFVPTGVGCGNPPASMVAKLRKIMLDGYRTHVHNIKPFMRFPLEIVNTTKKKLGSIRNPISKRTFGPIILISRKAVNRRLVQEDEIINLIKKDYRSIPFVIFHGNESFNETMFLFRSARVFIAPHGAGLSNIIWASPNTAILEIGPSYSFNQCFKYLAEQLNIVYYLQLAENGTSATPLYINMSIFRVLLKTMMVGRQ